MKYNLRHIFIPLLHHTHRIRFIGTTCHFYMGSVWPSYVCRFCTTSWCMLQHPDSHTMSPSCSLKSMMMMVKDEWQNILKCMEGTP